MKNNCLPIVLDVSIPMLDDLTETGIIVEVD